MKLVIGICFLYFAAAYGAPRIIGGRNAADGKYPYMVSLRENNFHFCGGSIIDKRWILTAGHCLQGLKHTSINVVAGANLLQGGKEQIYQSEYIVVHKSFDNPPYSNDIGLIRVSKDIEFNNKIQPVKLPKTNVSKNGTSAVFSGWGSTELWGESPNHLQEVALKILDQDTCKKEMAHIGDISFSQICTLTKHGQGICHGDSGSALVANGVQVGIASFVDPCAIGKPDVYARVYSFLDWIEAEQAKF